MNVLIIWLGFLYFCYISSSFSKSVRYPLPPPPPKCEPSVSTKHKCIDTDCACGWCFLEDKGQSKKNHDPIGNCFVYSDHPEYIEKKCGSVNSTVHTHTHSKMCHVGTVIFYTLLGIWFAIIVIVCIVGCIIGFIDICLSGNRKFRRNDVPMSTMFDEL